MIYLFYKANPRVGCLDESTKQHITTEQPVRGRALRPRALTAGAGALTAGAGAHSKAGGCTTYLGRKMIDNLSFIVILFGFQYQKEFLSKRS